MGEPLALDASTRKGSWIGATPIKPAAGQPVTGVSPSHGSGRLAGLRPPTPLRIADVQPVSPPSASTSPPGPGPAHARLLSRSQVISPKNRRTNTGPTQVRRAHYLDLSGWRGLCECDDELIEKLLAAFSQCDAIDNLNIARTRNISFLVGTHLLPENYLGDSVLVEVILPLISSINGVRETLDVSGNDLTDQVAPKLARLFRMASVFPRELLLGGNRFTSAGLCELLAMNSLQTLDISRNEVRQWPQLSGRLERIGDLQRLDVSYTGLTDATFTQLLLALGPRITHLTVKGNSLCILPSEIGRFTSLASLDLSRNSLEVLGTGLLHLRETCTVDLSGNPYLYHPPKDVVAAGFAEVRSWLSNSARGDEDEHLRLIVIGHAGQGKTSLLWALQEFAVPGTARPPFDLAPHTLSLDPRITISVSDFPGRIEYSRIYSRFITLRNSLVVVAAALSPTPSLEALKEQLTFWLEVLSIHFAGAASRFAWKVALVCTKADLVDNRPTVTRLATDLHAWAKAQYPQLPLADKVFVVSTLVSTTSTPPRLTRRDSGSLTGSSRNLSLQRDDQPQTASVADLARSLLQMATNLVTASAGFRVFDFMRRAEKMIPQVVASIGPVCDVQSFRHWAAYYDTNLISLGPHRWKVALKWLHERGTVLEFEDQVCLLPSAILDLLASFSPPPFHKAWTNSLLPPPAVFAPEAVIAAKVQLRVPGLASLGDQLFVLFSFMRKIGIAFSMLDREVKAWQAGDEPSLYLPMLREVAEMPFPPTLLLPTPPASDNPVRLLGVQLEVDDAFRASETFFDFSLGLRQWMHPDYRYFANLMILRDDDTGTQAQISCDLAGHKVIAVAAGREPKPFLDQLATRLIAAGKARSFSFSAPSLGALCGECLMSTGIHSVVLLESWVCSLGHALQPAEVENGKPIDPDRCRFNSLWSPAEAVRFYSSAVWQQHGGALRSTVLTAEDKDDSLRKEYARVRRLFYRFLREDSVRTFELEKVVFLDNPVLESAFQKFYGRSVQRFLTAQAASANFSHLFSESRPRNDWRSWVLSRLESYPERVSGNGIVNLVPSWHGTTEENMYKIAEGNFLEPHELEKQTDPGFFGKGIYFTQYPSYGAQYTRAGHCLLLSLVLMGRPYPVVESPMEPGQGLLGAPCREGFDSHYVAVRLSAPGGPSGAEANVYLPCPTDGTPDYDELVVFSKTQILPRYIIHFRRTEKQEPSPLQKASPAYARHVLWVDDLLGEASQTTLRLLRSLHPDSAIIPVTSTSETIVWLSTNAELLRGQKDTVRVVTTRRRAADGGDDAARLLVHSLRQNPQTAHVKVLVYCHNTKEVADVEDRRTTFVTADSLIMKDFCGWTFPATAWYKRL